MDFAPGYDWIKSCKICGGERFTQLTTAPKMNFYQCEDCLVIFLNPQPTQATLKEQYTRQGLLDDGPASAWFNSSNVTGLPLARIAARVVSRRCVST